MAEEHIVEIDTVLNVERLKDGVHEVITPHGWFLEHIEPHQPTLQIIWWLQQDDPNLTVPECMALIREAKELYGWPTASPVE